MADNEWNKIEDEFKNLGALNSPEVKGTTIFFFFFFALWDPKDERVNKSRAFPNIALVSTKQIKK